MTPMITQEEFQRLEAVEIREIDADTVIDIRSIQIDPALSPGERIRDAARQMGVTPFVYRCGGVLVKASFSGTQPLQTVLEDCLEHSP